MVVYHRGWLGIVDYFVGHDEAQSNDVEGRTVHSLSIGSKAAETTTRQLNFLSSFSQQFSPLTVSIYFVECLGK